MDNEFSLNHNNKINKNKFKTINRENGITNYMNKKPKSFNTMDEEREFYSKIKMNLFSKSNKTNSENIITKNKKLLPNDKSFNNLEDEYNYHLKKNSSKEETTKKDRKICLNVSRHIDKNIIKLTKNILTNLDIEKLNFFLNITKNFTQTGNEINKLNKKSHDFKNNILSRNISLNKIEANDPKTFSNKDFREKSNYNNEDKNIIKGINLSKSNKTFKNFKEQNEYYSEIKKFFIGENKNILKNNKSNKDHIRSKNESLKNLDKKNKLSSKNNKYFPFGSNERKSNIGNIKNLNKIHKITE